MSSIKKGRPSNPDRQNAITLGFRTYTGALHTRCGTTERYVSSGGCVHCARVLTTEQREARVLLKAQAAQKILDECAGATHDGPAANLDDLM